MPLPKISEARELTDEQLTEEIIAVKKQLFQLRLQKATRQLDKPHLFRHARHRLAQLMTVEAERQRQQASQYAKQQKE
jgi:large subunit ribosomal protein L29